MADTAGMAPRIRVSTLLGMAVMDACEAGAMGSASIMLHRVPDELREQIRARLIAAGWEPNDDSGNDNMRGARDPETGAYVAMWT